MEPGETERETLCREFVEELGAEALPIRRLWRSTTPWGVELAWWLAEVVDGQSLVASPEEVESIHWFSVAEMRELPELLESNRGFLDAMQCGEFTIEGI